MISCPHPHTVGKLCARCYMALAEVERHFFVICTGAAKENVEVVIIPNGITPDRAREIADLCGARMGGVAPTQANLFGDATGSGTVNAL